MRNRWTILLVWLSSLGLGLAAESSTAKLYEKVLGGQLRILVQCGDAKVTYIAGGFYEWSPDDPTKKGAVTHLFATRFHVEASGQLEATYQSVPVAYRDGYAESTLVRLILDQDLEVKNLNPELIGAIGTDRADLAAISTEAAAWARHTEQHQRAAGRSPVHILIYPQEEPGLDPQCEIRITPFGLTDPEAESSHLLETKTRFELSQGEVLEKRDPTAQSPAPRLPAVHIGAASGTPNRTHSNLRPPRFDFVDPKARTIQTTQDGGWLISGNTTILSESETLEGTEGGFGDLELDIAWEFATGRPPDVGWVEAADRRAGSWLPEYNGLRRFTVNLKRPNSVEAVRFVLSNVSRHSGIATNAGHALLQPDPSEEPRFVSIPVKLESGSTTLRWRRKHPSLTTVPEDELPDLYFEQNENAGFDMESAFEWEGQSVSSQISTSLVARQVTAKVRVRDWGASGKLHAEVLMNGFWETLEARGETASEDGLTLQIPLDQNENGICDAFEADLGSATDGDALPLLEEYRGIYAQGEFRRLDPRRHDLFLHDYLRKLDREQKSLIELFARSNVDLHFVGPKEHRTEFIGAQPVLVLEDLRDHAFPAVLAVPVTNQAEAWRALAPSQGNTTAFLDAPVPVEYIAKDLATLVGIEPPQPPSSKTP